MMEKTMEEIKRLGDLEGWNRIGGLVSPIGTHYGFYSSPDKGQLALVHEDDDEVTMIFDRSKRMPSYLHPVTMKGLKSLGFESIEEATRHFRSVINSREEEMKK